jgi:hypothetical protein
MTVESLNHSQINGGANLKSAHQCAKKMDTTIEYFYGNISYNQLEMTRNPNPVITAVDAAETFRYPTFFGRTLVDNKIHGMPY